MFPLPVTGTCTASPVSRIIITTQIRNSLIGSLAVSLFHGIVQFAERDIRVYDKTDLTVTLDEKPGYGGIWSTSFDVKGSGMAEVPIKFSFTPEADTMVCTLGFPGMLEGGLSQAFPVINKQPPSDRGRQLFTEDDPEGVPWKGDEAAPLRMHYIVGIVLVVALCMAFSARLFHQKRKQRKASQTLMAQAESGGLMEDSKTRYTDDM